MRLLFAISLVFASLAAPSLLDAQCAPCNGRGASVCGSCGGRGYTVVHDKFGAEGHYGCTACGGRRGEPFNNFDPEFGKGVYGRGRFSCGPCEGTGLSPAQRAEIRRREEERRRKEAEAKKLIEQFDALCREGRWEDADALFLTLRKDYGETQALKDAAARIRERQDLREALKRSREVAEQIVAEQEARRKREAQLNEAAARVDKLTKDLGEALNGAGGSDAGGLDFFDGSGTSRAAGGDGTKTLFDRGTKNSAPPDARVKGPSKLDVGENVKIPVVPAKIDPPLEFLDPKAESAVVPPVDSDLEFLYKDFLRPGESARKTFFPPNPGERLKNVLTDPALKAEAERKYGIPEPVYKDFADKLLKGGFDKVLDDDLHVQMAKAVGGLAQNADGARYLKESEGIAARRKLEVRRSLKEAFDEVSVEFAKLIDQGHIARGQTVFEKEKSDPKFEAMLDGIRFRAVLNHHIRMSAINDAAFNQMDALTERLNREAAERGK